MKIQPSVIGNLADRAVGAASFAFNEIKEAGENDPALAMRLAATAMSGQVLNGVAEPIVDSYQKSIVPIVRGGLLALDIYRANRTFKNPAASLAEKGLDGLRVATDLVGFAGGILGLVMPQLKATGDGMMGFAYAADVVSHAIRGLDHGAHRVKVWNDIRRKKSGAEAPGDRDKGDRTPTAPPIASPPKTSVVSAPASSGLFVAPTSTAQQYLNNMNLTSTAPVAVAVGV